MNSAFGVEHSGISKMSDDELRHRKRVQAGLSTAGAVVGLSALGAKGVKVGTGRYIKPASRAAKYNAKIDTGVNNALVVGAGVGGASGLNSAAISRKEAGKKHIHKADGNRRIGAGAGIASGGAATRYHYGRKAIKLYDSMSPGTKPWAHADAADRAYRPWEMAAKIHHADQHDAFIRDASKQLPKIKAGRKIGAAAVVGGSLIAASGAKNKLGNEKRKHVAKSAFGVEHDIVAKSFGSTPSSKQRQRLSPTGQKVYRHSKDAAFIGIGGGTLVNMAGSSLSSSGKTGNLNALAETLGEKKGSKNIARMATHARKIKVGTALERGGNAATVAGLGAAGVATALGSRAKHKKVSKAFDPESRRHTQLGIAAGVAGTTSVVSGASAAKSAKKAHGHYKMASGANQATKTRLLEGLNLRGAAEAQHAHKTALTHGEMLGHVKAGNAASRSARGKAGIALGSAAAAGAIMHHSNNGAANYVGPYQPKAKYAQGAKKTYGRIKNKIS